MKSIKEQLQYIKTNKKIGIMTHVVAGYPTIQDTYNLVLSMCGAGVDFVEIQIPFSDPIADGPVIMRANDVALSQGVTISNCFELVKKLSNKVDIPLLLMGYYNSVLNLGVETFCRRSHEAGVQGLIIPDIPIDEEPYENFISSCEKYHLNHIRVLSPTSTEERIALNSKVQNGFVYCTTYAGVTGMNDNTSRDLNQYLKRIRNHITVPLAVGFGISKKADIEALVGQADIAIIGSAISEYINQHGIKNVKTFINRFTFVNEK